MKHDNNKLSSSAAKTNHDDEIIGAALSRGLVQSEITHAEECPGPEEIAAVVEGNAAADERDRVLKHISACPDCYELFLLTVELHNDVEKTVEWEKVEQMAKVARNEARQNEAKT